MKSLFYYHRPGLEPFRNLMELSDQAIIEFMRLHLPDDPIFHQNPERYIRRRRETEVWLHENFSSKGGMPLTCHPVYMTGRSSYIEAMGIYTERLEFPLSLFSPAALSFTYPDSYVSRLLAERADHSFNLLG